MTTPHRHARAALLVALAALCLGSALAQPQAMPLKSYYVGALASGPGPGEPVLLDLTLWEDGFAFARLQLPRQRSMLYGTGRLKDGTELRIAFRRPSRDLDPWWAAEAARRAASGTTYGEDPGEPVAVLRAQRDYDWAAEGRTIVGVLRLASGEPLELTVARLAAAARWSYGYGRVSSVAELPRFPGWDELNGWLQERVLPALDGFATEGLELDDEGALGWGWWREERVDLAGVAGPFVSLLSTTDDYTGGAHPNSFHESLLLEVSGDVVPLGLSDLFAGDGWLEELSALVLDDLASQGALWVTDGSVEALGETDLEVFTLDATGVTFHFSPYLMGPYVQGTFRVTVPYDAVEHLAAPDGPLASFARGDWPELDARLGAQR